MLWKVRATLSDRPGSLAELARRCGEAGVDVQDVLDLTLQDVTVQIRRPAPFTPTERAAPLPSPTWSTTCWPATAR